MTLDNVLNKINKISTIAVMSNMNKRKLCEALEINRLKTLNEIEKTFKVLNRDNGD